MRGPANGGGAVTVADAARGVDCDPTPLLSDGRSPHVRWGLFLDVDGTLLEFAERPDRVTVSAALIAQLRELSAVMSGAVALVSGRTVAQLDRLFAPLRLPTAGVHGLERRGADGRLQVHPRNEAGMAQACAALQALVSEHPALLLEDKGGALALHVRGAPALAEQVRGAVGQVAHQLGPQFHVLEGHRVFEIKPALPDKGTAIESFLLEPPFTGRLPVFLGDDTTDRAGFQAVGRHGGISIAVGPRVSAPWKLADATAVHAWLRTLIIAGRPTA